MKKLKTAFVIILTLTCISASSLFCLGYGVSGREIFATSLSSPAPKPLPPPPQTSVNSKTADTFTAIDPKSLVSDSLQSFNPAKPFRNGEITYTGNYSDTTVPGNKQWSSYLFFHKYAGGNLVETQIIKPNHVTSNYIYDPQFSSNGRYITFKYGWPYDSHNSFDVYLWDTETKNARIVLTQSLSAPDTYLFYPQLIWSPDSKYLTNIRGGDNQRLYIKNIDTGANHFVDNNPYVTHLTWTRQNTLLYCKIPENEKADISPRNSIIYEYNPAESSSKILIKGGFDPKPSPDGKHIVYFGWPQDNSVAITKEKDKQNSHMPQQAQIGLYLFDRTTGKKTLLLSPVSHLTFINMIWEPDGNEIIFLKFLSRSPHAKAQITEINISDKTSKSVAIVTADDFMELPRTKNNLEINTQGITTNGHFLFIKKSEGVGDNGSLVIEKNSIDAINLSDGSIIEGAVIKGSLGYDWWGNTEFQAP